jgi:nickel/cobalt transporter (NiCoT) family protein
MEHILGDGPGSLRMRVAGLYVLLFGFNAVAWLWAAVTFAGRPLLMGSAMLAYSLGLRHAFDADHIAAIDNVTRKMMRQGRQPAAVGLFFALGHSTVVVALSLAIAVGAEVFGPRFGWLRDVGGIIGSSISVCFLLAIAGFNMLSLRSAWFALLRTRRSGSNFADSSDFSLVGQGPLGRIFGNLFRYVDRGWHMCAIGLLFGLGFDTATEVGLLGMSATSATQGLNLSSILIFPFLFTAGMALADTTDSILMVSVYSSARANPMHRAYYSVTITGISVGVALFVASIELLQMLGRWLDLRGGIWARAGTLCNHSGTLGSLIFVIFIAFWLVSAGFDHFSRARGVEIRS